MSSEILLHWQAKEYERKEKTVLWYLVAALFLGGIVLYSVFTGSPIVAVTFILIGVVGYLLLEKDPRPTDFTLTENGIRIGNELYPYENIHSFWMPDKEDATNHFGINTDFFLLPNIRIPFGDADPQLVRSILIKHLPQKKYRQGIIDILYDMF